MTHNEKEEGMKSWHITLIVALLGLIPLFCSPYEWMRLFAAFSTGMVANVALMEWRDDR